MQKEKTEKPLKIDYNKTQIEPFSVEGYEFENLSDHYGISTVI